MEYYKNKYRNDSARLKNWDYGSPGYYFVTIQTEDRKCYFGDIIDNFVDNDSDTDNVLGGMRDGNVLCGMCAGNVGTQNFASLQPNTHPAQSQPNPHPTQSLQPNAHPTQLMQPNARPTQSNTQSSQPHNPQLHPTPIGKIARQYWIEIPNHFPFVVLDEFVVMPNHVHGILKFNKPGYRGWKKNAFAPQTENLASVIRGYKAAVSKYATLHNIEFAWQSRYHDHVVESQKRLNIIRQYIKNNPAKWTNENAQTRLNGGYNI